VDLGAAGMRILAVVPVDQQDPHSAPYSRATASSTPFTNAGALAPANQWASFTASSITTRGGVAPSASSARARRKMLFSTTPTRSRRQCSAASATRRLEGARHPNHVDLRLGHALLAEALPRALQQTTGDDLVVTGDDHGHADLTRRAGRTQELGHDQCVSRWPSLSRLASR